jgi:hypothetical protein
MDRVNYILEKTSSISHLTDFTKLKSLEGRSTLPGITLLCSIKSARIDKTHSFEDTWSTFGMPPFDIASELLTGVKNSVVIFLVLNRADKAVTEHSLSQMWEGFHWV